MDLATHAEMDLASKAMNTECDVRSASPQLDELDFLSKAAVSLLEQCFPEEVDIGRFITEQLAAVVPDALVWTSRFDPQREVCVVQAVAGSAEMLALVRAALGREMCGTTFPLNDAGRRVLGEGHLVRLDERLRALVLDPWVFEVVRRCETQFGVRSIHVQPFARKGDFLGTVGVLSRAPRLANARLFEAFVRVAAVAIQRHRLAARLQESESRFRMLAENSPDVIFRLRLEPERTFEYVSPAATRVVGLSPQELYADADLGAPCLYSEEWVSGAPPETPTEPVVARCAHPDGTYTWTEQLLTLSKCERGEVVALEGVVRDITKRKEAEDALLLADRRKNDFLAVLSHELRNPLGPIRSALYILDHVDPASAQGKRARAVIERQISHLARIVDDLLDVTRITCGKVRLQRESMDLLQVVRATVEDHRSIFERNRNELEVVSSSDEISINGDRTRIAQVVGNLLLNAAKFTPPGGRTTVSLSVDPVESRATLRVRDTGTGITQEILPHLFTPFTQADTSLDRSRGGLGLGLMLVKGFVEMHGGSVTAHSEGPGKGAEFVVRLPLDRAAQSRRQPASVERCRHVRVLVIEDNVDAAETLREALVLKGHDVEVSYDGRSGIERARAFRPDVVLCDIGLPGLDGYGVAAAVRAAPELRAVRLVALTGYASAEDVARARRAGFDRHLSKPPAIEVIERVCSELVGPSGRGAATAGASTPAMNGAPSAPAGS